MGYSRGTRGQNCPKSTQVTSKTGARVSPKVQGWREYGEADQTDERSYLQRKGRFCLFVCSYHDYKSILRGSKQGLC